ncbi:helix-turn-helix domain-containing protein [Streptomyces avermitilis]|uniref:helix-turn-helix domain-containing protein n=1 Tax=Streptomyces avermitilis TaxID=33903 RepID=UPI003530E28B
MDVQQLAKYRYRAVREVLGGHPIGEVAARYGTSRQTLHSWRRRFEQEGMPGLLDRSRRPRSSPTRLSAEVEAEICELRRRHPRWGARRISHELAARGLESAAAFVRPRVGASEGGLQDVQHRLRGRLVSHDPDVRDARQEGALGPLSAGSGGRQWKLTRATMARSSPASPAAWRAPRASGFWTGPATSTC